MRTSSLLLLAGAACATRAAPPPTSQAAAVPSADLELLCPTKDVHGYQLERGDAPGTNAADAIALARERATANLLERACSGLDQLRCEAIHRKVKPWKQGYFDQEGAWACASVSVESEALDSLSRDAAVLDSQLRTLAFAVAEGGRGEPLLMTAPTWASGCSAGSLGQALIANLQNHLAKFPDLRMADPDARVEGAVRLRTSLAPSAGGVTLSAALTRAEDMLGAPLPGFTFPLDLFGVDPTEAGTCRSDDHLGLTDGERPGAGGLRVTLDVPGVDGVVCEGTRVEPVVVVNQPSLVQVFSVASDGRTLHIWPPPDLSPRVDRSLSLGSMTVVTPTDGGDERLVAMAVPIGSKRGPTGSWAGFCEVPGGLGPALYPPDGAVGSITFTVVPAGSRDCDEVPGINALRGQAANPPSCDR